MTMRFIFLAIAVLLAGCGDNAAAPRKQASIQADGSRHDAVRPFPQATEVRLVTGHDFFRNDQMETRYDKPIQLTDAQRKAYEQLLFIQTDGDLGVAACFEPHHFFRYYDARGKKIGEVAVCFCCGGVAMSPDTLHLNDNNQLFSFDHARLKALIASWGVATDIDCPPSAS